MAEVEPGVVLYWCRPSASRSGVLCLERCFSVHQDYKDLWPLSPTRVSSQRLFVYRTCLENFVVENPRRKAVAEVLKPTTMPQITLFPILMLDVSINRSHWLMHGADWIVARNCRCTDVLIKVDNVFIWMLICYDGVYETRRLWVTRELFGQTQSHLPRFSGRLSSDNCIYGNWPRLMRTARHIN